jgi:hypothetical protein
MVGKYPYRFYPGHDVDLEKGSVREGKRAFVSVLLDLGVLFFYSAFPGLELCSRGERDEAEGARMRLREN